MITGDEKEQLKIYSHTQKIVDNFVVEFVGLPPATGNTFSKQVISIGRPEMSFDVSNQGMKRNTYKNPMKHRFGNPIQMTLRDDEDSVTSTLVRVAFMRMLYRHKIPNRGEGSPHDGRFDVVVTILNSRGNPVEKFSLRNAFFSSVKYSDLTYTEDTYSTITTQISFDNLSFSISPNMQEYDEFVADRDVFTWIDNGGQTIETPTVNT